MRSLLAVTLGSISFLALSAPGHASTTSVNLGTLGAAANGTNTDSVALGQPSPLDDPNDTSAGYGGGGIPNPKNTTVPYNAALNPAASQPFTIEFWVNPAQDTNNGWAPVFNRVSTAPRSGWTFFQRGSAGGGWHFALYSGVGTSVGAGITAGGSSFVVGSWTHVVGIWNGTTPSLFINGVDSGVAASGTGYNVAGNPILSIGSYADGDNSFLGGLVDETAFYNRALSSAEIAEHYAAASSTTPGTYSGVVLGDSPLLYLPNAQIPEPGTFSLLALGLLANRRRR